MREVQRVVKSIVQGPCSTVDDQSEADSEKIFDDLHVIICMNTLLACEHRIPTETDDETNDMHPQFKSILPIAEYTKLHKLLRNLIIYSSQTVESI